MLKASLAYLAKFLEDHFSGGSQPVNIVFEERERVFRRISKNDNPIQLPAIAFFASDINPVLTRESLQKVRLQSNTNDTQALVCQTQTVAMRISLVLLAAKLDDYFDMMNAYFSILHGCVFPAELSIDGYDFKTELNIRNIEPLTVPPAFLETRDYEDSEYYAYDGGFELLTALMYTSNKKLITSVRSQIVLQEFYPK